MDQESNIHVAEQLKKGLCSDSQIQILKRHNDADDQGAHCCDRPDLSNPPDSFFVFNYSMQDGFFQLTKLDKSCFKTNG